MAFKQICTLKINVCSLYNLSLKCLHLILVSCLSLTAPNNGNISCLPGDDKILSSGDTCSFTCNTNYELTGNDTRTCQSGGIWTDKDVMCRCECLNLCTYVAKYSYIKLFNMEIWNFKIGCWIHWPIILGSTSVLSTGTKKFQYQPPPSFSFPVLELHRSETGTIILLSSKLELDL